MPLELTDEERAAYVAIAKAHTDAGVIAFDAYLAGMRAGIKRAAMIADDVTWDSEYHDMWHVGFDAAAKACVAAIRALLK